jgi:drug/metabolite transporter (DMT)-like permease
MMASVPVWTSLFGLAFLGERLASRELLGIALTVGGIAWAVSHRVPRKASPTTDPSEPSTWRMQISGVVLALGGALGQAGGLILSKHGMADYDPFAATQIRVLAGIVGFALVITLWRWWPRTIAAVRDVEAMIPTGVGALFGPFLGVGLSLVAIQLAPTGVAASLMATTPILMLPVSLVRGEPVGIAGAIGAVLAVSGVVLLLT